MLHKPSVNRPKLCFILPERYWQGIANTEVKLELLYNVEFYSFVCSLCFANGCGKVFKACVHTTERKFSKNVQGSSKDAETVSGK